MYLSCAAVRAGRTLRSRHLPLPHPQRHEVFPDSPVYIMSDGGYDYSQYCAQNKCMFKLCPPANDRWHPWPFMHRMVEAAKALDTEFLVRLFLLHCIASSCIHLLRRCPLRTFTCPHGRACKCACTRTYMCTHVCKRAHTAPGMVWMLAHEHVALDVYHHHAVRATHHPTHHNGPTLR